MILPQGHQATIDERKLTDYCLSPEHDEGKHKAHLFRELLGLEREHAGLLLEALRNAAENGDARQGIADVYGQRFVVDFDMDGPTGRVRVRSAWILRTREAAPRFVSCYIL
jgi:hypothetical protein